MGEAAEVIQIEESKMIKEFKIQEITESNLALMKEKILEIPEMPEDSKQYNTVKDYHIQAKKVLPRIEERRKELKAPVLERGRTIDETAKKAVSMIQPLIDMAGSRRSAWEDQKAKEKAEKERVEKERLEAVEKHCDSLEAECTAGLAYNLASAVIFRCLHSLKSYEVSAVDFQERTEWAEQRLAKGLEETETAYQNRLKFEEEQARQEEERKRLAEEQARIKTEQEEQSRKLAEEKAKIEAERKAQEDAAREKAAEEARKRRIEEEKLSAERDALEKEKARIEAEKQAAIEQQKAIDQFNQNHAEALGMHERYLMNLDLEIDQARADASARWESEKKARAEKLKADAARAKLVAIDKKAIKQVADYLDSYINAHDFPVMQTTEAAVLVVKLVGDINTAIHDFETDGENLV